MARGSPATQQFFFDELLQESAQLALLLAVQVPDTAASISALQVGDTTLLARLARDELVMARFTAWFPSYVLELRGRAVCCGVELWDEAVRSAIAVLSARDGVPWSTHHGRLIMAELSAFRELSASAAGSARDISGKAAEAAMLDADSCDAAEDVKNPDEAAYIWSPGATRWGEPDLSGALFFKPQPPAGQ